MAGHKLQKDYTVVNVKILKGSSIEVDGVKLEQLREAGFIAKPKPVAKKEKPSES